MDEKKIPSYQYKKPLVWVDTNVIIDMARARKGIEKDENKKTRSLKLYETLHKLAMDFKIIYLESHQREEYGYNPDILKECDDIQTSLSQGIRINHEATTKQFQMQRMMKVYCGKLESFTLEDSDIFSSDPTEEYASVKQSGLIISVRFPIKDKDRAESRKIRDNIISDWENLRKERRKVGMKYEEALSLEYTGEWLAVANVLKKWMADPTRLTDSSEEGIMEYFGDSHTLSPFRWWEVIVGKKNDLVGLKQFMYSDNFKNIPIVDIHSKLLAYLVTTDHEVKRGDYVDSQMVSVVLPYCDIVITDSALKHRLNVLKLPEKYQAQIYSLKDIDEVIKKLEAFDSPKK